MLTIFPRVLAPMESGVEKRIRSPSCSDDAATVTWAVSGTEPIASAHTINTIIFLTLGRLRAVSMILHTWVDESLHPRMQRLSVASGNFWMAAVPNRRRAQADRNSEDQQGRCPCRYFPRNNSRSFRICRSRGSRSTDLPPKHRCLPTH